MVDTDLSVVKHSQYNSDNLISSHRIYILDNTYLIGKCSGENGSEAATRKSKSRFPNLHALKDELLLEIKWS